MRSWWILPLFLALLCWGPAWSMEVDSYTLMQQAEQQRQQGHHTLALQMLLQEKTRLESQAMDADPRLYALLLNRLGDLYLQWNDWEKAAEFLVESVVLARDLGDDLVLAANLNNYGIMMAMAGRDTYAEDAFNESMELALAAGDLDIYWQAAGNAVRLYWSRGERDEARAMLHHALEDLSAHRWPRRTESNKDLARLLHRIRHQMEPNDPLAIRLAKFEGHLLQRAWKSAKSAYARSLIAGFLGDWHDEAKRTSEAMRWTRRALFLAQRSGRSELLYRWQWQLGRLFLAQGERDTALVWLRRAVKTLAPIQPSMLRGFRSLESPFERRIRTIYRTLADALLQTAEHEQRMAQRQRLLEEARNALEMMKNAELQDYFKSDCMAVADEQQVRLDEIDRYTAVVYPISLPDRLALLVSTSGHIRQTIVPVDAARLRDTLLHFRRLLQTRSNNLFLYPAQQLYRWLIAPIQAQLRQAGIRTLVFVPDAGLRSIPFSALHDGKQFLIERFAIAVTPGLTLTTPHAMDKRRIQALVLGISDAVQDFPPLPSVQREVRDVAALFRSTTLLNGDFTETQLQRTMEEQPYTVLHLATHGVFGGSPEDSFLLAYDEKIDMNRLRALIGLSKHHREPLELLTMSACQTAIGDDRSSLGLAGAAIKAGARSALASLWYVDDEATALMIRIFYHAWKQPGISKAEALQQAQKALIARDYFWHPAYWSPFLLIGNWL